VSKLNQQAILAPLKETFYGEEWAILLQVGRDSDYSYADPFWTKEEPMNTVYLCSISGSKDFSRSIKSQHFYQLPVTELLIISELGRQSRLKFDQEQILCKIFQNNKYCPVKCVSGE
jgi:hypothetical protein